MASTFITFLPWYLGTLSALFLFINFLFKLKNSSSKRLPPGPPGWPLVGNIFDLGEVPHQTFYKLQAKYGPVLWLKLGAVNTMVVQTEAAAAELFKKCDLSFSDRNVPDALTALDYHQGSIAMGCYGEYWRRLSRICTTEFLVHKRLNASMPIRRKSIENMIERIKEDVERSKENGGNGEIRIDWAAFVMTFNTIGNILLSRDVMQLKVHKASEFFDALVSFMKWIGKPNLGDFVPILKWADPQGIRRNTEKYLERLIRFTSELVTERIQEKGSGKVKEANDFLDTLLDEGEAYEEGPDKLSVKNIAILLLEMFVAGTETTSTSIEWGMTELVRHPNTIKKIQDEIDKVVGRIRMVEEEDLNNMPYLQATIKEILRLHPVVQMLLPRKAREDTEYMGYLVPKNTQILVNAWGIHRDPAAWPEPLLFKPERFLDSDVDLKGQHFQLIPFGAGRRSCLGTTLGHRVVSLALANLLQTFDWELGDGVKPEGMDMRETMGLTLHKKVPLKVIPTLRVRD